MNLTKALHLYRCGALIQQTDEDLNEAQRVLERKIEDLDKVMRHVTVCDELYDDRRQYCVVRDEIARLLERRQMAA